MTDLSSPGGLDVLIVEDEVDLANSTAEILRGAGYRVQVANSLEDAVEVMASRAVRSVILDHHLGEAASDALLAPGHALPPVIAVSGIGRERLEQLKQTYGARLAGCLSKPVPPAQLIRAVVDTIGDGGHE